MNGNDDGNDDESSSSSSWPIQPVHVCTFWAEHLKISFDLVAICIGTGSEVCAQKVHVIRRSQISTGLKTVFKPDWSTKQEKTWKHFLKHSLFQRWIENIVSVSTWQRPCELMMGLSGIFFGLFSLRPPRDGRKLFCDCRIAIVCHVTQPPCSEDLIQSLSNVQGTGEKVAVKKSWSFVKLVTSYWSTVQQPVYQSSTQQSFNLFWHQPTFPLMRACVGRDCHALLLPLLVFPMAFIQSLYQPPVGHTS